MQTVQLKRLFQNFFSLGLAQGIVSALQLLVIPFVIRHIGADGFGVVAVAQVVIFYLAICTDYGFNQTAVREVALNRDNSVQLSKIFSRVLLTKMLLTFLTFLVLLLLVTIIPFLRLHAKVYFTAFSFVVGQIFLMNWFFQGMERMWLIVITTLLARLFFVAGIFIFMRNAQDDYLFLFLMGIGNCLGGLLGLLLIKYFFHIKWSRPHWQEVRAELHNGWPFLVSNLSMTTCQYANIFFLRLFTNDLTVGYFSVAERIYFTLKQVLSIFSQGVYPAVCHIVTTSKSQLLSFFRIYFVPFLVLVTIGVVTLWFLASDILFLFSGAEYDHSVFPLRILGIILLVVCLNIPFTLFLQATNHRKEYLRIFLAGALVNIAANLVLVPLWQSNGTLVSIGITELFITIGVFFSSSRSFNWNTLQRSSGSEKSN